MTPRRFSFVVLAVTIVLIGVLRLGAPFLALLFSYFVLTKLGRVIRYKWIVFAVFILVLAGISYTAVHFSRAAIAALPKIAEESVPAAIEYAEKHIGIDLPFSDWESLKTSVSEQLKDQTHYLGNVATSARHASTILVFVIIGVVCAISIFFNSRLDLFRESHSIKNNLYSVCADEIGARFREFYQSFATVIGAQMMISCVNTILTALFVVIIQLPYAPVVVGLTFLCGLVPIIGNVVSNTVIVFIGFTVSPKVAIFSLIFLIVIHKLEYFLNSKIIGARIRNPIWLTLFGLIIGERLMGVPGMILSPVVLNYLRVEMVKVEVKPSVPSNPPSASL